MDKQTKDIDFKLLNKRAAIKNKITPKDIHDFRDENESQFRLRKKSYSRNINLAPITQPVSRLSPSMTGE